MRRRLASLRSCVVAGACALSLVSGAASGQSLSDTLVTAYANSDLLAADRAELRAADEDVAQAVSALRPLINIVSRTTESTRAGQNLNNVTSLTLDLLLFDFGNTPLGVEAADQVVMATRAALLNLEQDVLLDAVTVHMDMISETQTVALAANSLRLNEEEERAARDRFELGEVTLTDVSQAEAQVALARSTLALAQGDLEIARSRYKLAVGVFPGSVREAPPLPALPPSEEEAQAIAARTHPLIRQGQFLARAADINVARAEAAMRPELRLGGDVSYSARDDRLGENESATINLDLNVPVYQGGRLKSLYRQAVATTQGARSDVLQSVRVVADGLSQAWARLEVARATIAARREQVRAARVAFESIREEARLGSRTTLDVLDTEQDLLDAQTNLVRALRDEQVAVYATLSAMGLLTVEHLGLAVELHDPDAYYRQVRRAPVRSVEGEKLDRVLERLGRN